MADFNQAADYNPADDPYYKASYDPSNSNGFNPNNNLADNLSTATPNINQETNTVRQQQGAQEQLFNVDLGAIGLQFLGPEFSSLISGQGLGEVPGLAGDATSKYIDLQNSKGEKVAAAGDGGSDGFASKYLKSLKDYIFSEDGQKLALTTIAGGIGSINREKNARKTLAIAQQNADTNRLSVQNTVDNEKRRFNNASAIGQTNFGSATPTGLIYKNILAERRARNGA